MDNLKLNNILFVVIIVLLCIMLYKMYNKRENAASVSGETLTSLSNEAVQNIASVYAETTGTVNFNNLNAQNLNAINFRGIIVAWSGTVANIPTGWALCDGTKGTPDLRGRFLRMLSKPGIATEAGYYTEPVSLPGVNPLAEASQGSGNGSSIAGLQKQSQIVGDLQIGSTGGTDSYQLQIAEMPAHNHPAWSGFANSTGGAQMGYATNANWTYTPPSDPQKRNGLTGGSGGHPSTPPYYVVAYIMKL